MKLKDLNSIFDSFGGDANRTTALRRLVLSSVRVIESMLTPANVDQLTQGLITSIVALSKRVVSTNIKSEEAKAINQEAITIEARPAREVMPNYLTDVLNPLLSSIKTQTDLYIESN